MSALFLTLICSFFIGLAYSTFLLRPNCNVIYGLCNPFECPLECHAYCDSEANNTLIDECCCDQIIKSGLDCNTNDPPCIIPSRSLNNNKSRIIFGIELSKQLLSPDIPINMTLFWNNSRFKCTTYSPTSSWLFYSCDVSDAINTKSCSTVITPNINQYGLLINVHHTKTQPLEIDRIIIKSIKNNILTNLYIIDSFFDDTDYNETLIVSHDALITFNQLNESQTFMQEMDGFVQQNQNISIECKQANLTKTRPESVDIYSEICIFGSMRSFLDGRYEYVAWNLDKDKYGPIYYNELEDKYLYWHVTEEESEQLIYLQIGDDYSSQSDFGYTRCPMMIDDPNRFDVTKCVEWRTDINVNPEMEDFLEDKHLFIENCHDDLPNDKESITFGFHIYEFWGHDDSTLSMTLFWNGEKYKCTIYTGDYVTGYDSYYYYTCNTLFNAMKCDANYNHHPYPIEFGLHFDIFKDDEERDAWILEDHAWTLEQGESIGIDSIIFKYMTGNVVHSTNIIDHFCANQSCSDILWVTSPHFLIQYNYSNQTYSDGLNSNVFPSTTCPQCVPDGYATDLNKYELVAQELSWEEANAYCQQVYNSSLATIISDEDLRFAVALRELVDCNKDVWIGLNDIDSNHEWEWVDGTKCNYVEDDKLCKNDPRWSPNEPEDEPYKWCAEMSGVTTFGYFNDEVCTDTNYFLCNSPTPSPTNAPSKSPTFHPTHDINSDNIIISNHERISSQIIAFKIENIDLSCGGEISMVEISDNYPYDGYNWITYTFNTSGYYIFNVTNNVLPSYTAPISIKISKTYNDIDQHIIGSRVLQSFVPRQKFDFEVNFCREEDIWYLETASLDLLLYPYSILIYLCIIITFCIIGCIAFLDSKIGCRRNDHFRIAGIASCLFQILDTMSDILFCFAVWDNYKNATFTYLKTQHQLLIIFIFSAIFIILPITISLYQLHKTVGERWLKNNRVREWLKSYMKLAYIGSILTGSPFSAIQIFNSNMFGLDIFYMGLTRDDILRFSTNKLKSIVLFENCPQLILSVFYMKLLMKVETVSVIQIILSFTSIILTIVTILQQKKIDKTQDFIYISLDVSGSIVLQNSKICKNKTNFLSKYLARKVLGVNAKWVNIQKPYGGAIRNGIRIECYISFINEANNDDIPLQHHYQYLLENIINSQKLAKLLKKEWNLTTLPYIKLNRCKLIESETSKNKKNNNLNQEEGIQNNLGLMIAVDGSFIEP